MRNQSSSVRPAPPFPDTDMRPLVLMTRWIRKKSKPKRYVHMYIAYVDRQKYILRSKIQFHILGGDEYASIKDIFTRLIGLVTKKIIDWLCHSILCRQFE